MEDMKMFCKLFELKGMVDSLSDIADQDEIYNYSMIERIQDKTKEIVEIIEAKGN